MRFLLLGAALFLSAANPAAAEDRFDGTQWLERIAASARSLTYSGTFVYQHGGQVETSRIMHLADESGEREKLETLDGTPREIIRENERVTCYLPNNKVVKVEEGSARRRSFPALLPGQVDSLGENYRIADGGRERIAGHDCQVLILEPKDGLRYAHKLWAERSSGLLVKASVYGQDNQVVEQFAFTRLEIGGPIDPRQLQASYAERSNGWRWDRGSGKEAAEAPSGWVVRTPPSGFRKVMEMKRVRAGKSEPVAHIMYSDGLAAVSVFIEPASAAGPKAGEATNRGAINVYVREVSSHLVTVVGETPAATVRQIADSVVFQGR